MAFKVPQGFNETQWAAIMEGLENNPSTMNDYRKVVNLLHSYDNGHYHILEMTREDAGQYFSYFEEKAVHGQMSPNTVHRYEATLRSVGKRIESRPDLFPGFINPFAGMIHNEKRNKTAYSRSTFADPKDIQKILKIIPTLPIDKQIMVELMLQVGLRTSHIQALTFASFTKNPRNPGELILTFRDSEYTAKPGSTLSFDQNKNARLLSTSSNGSTVWEITGTWRFFTNYSKKLKLLHSTLGEDTSDHPFFLTKKGMPFSYRTQHHMLQEVNVAAGLSPNAVTPYQLSLFGCIHSYLTYTVFNESTRLHNAAHTSKTSSERINLFRQKKVEDDKFLPLTKIGWIGNWTKEIPVCRRALVQEIIDQMGEDFIYEVSGASRK